jgi:hypothetical protein
MLTYKRIYVSENTVRYEFYPEGTGDAGIVEFVNGEGKITQNSKDDFESFYASHALQIDLNTENGSIAWY